MTPVPEPSTFVLAGMGFAGLAASGWRRRKTPLAGLLLAAFVITISVWAMPATAQGQIFVTTNYTSTIGEYTTSGATVNASLVSGLNGPEGIAVSGGNLYVTNTGGTTIGKYTTSGTTGDARRSRVSNIPTALAVSGGNLFVANHGTNTIGECPANQCQTRRL